MVGFASACGPWASTGSMIYDTIVTLGHLQLHIPHERSYEHEMSILRRRSPSPSPAVAPLEDEDLLSEILLRLPPQPCSLPRASAVCKRWRGIVSDPGFSCRFRRHHHRSPPPLLGFFVQGVDGISLKPTMETPNRVPPARFTMPSDARFFLLGCRHGLVLIFQHKLKQVLVWDPVAGDQHSFPEPPGFDAGKTPAGAVLRTAAAGDAHRFLVVLASLDNQQHHTRASAFIYSSETGLWSDRISTLFPSDDSMYFMNVPAVLAGDSLYWTLTGASRVLLEFDLDRESLAVIHLPLDNAALRHNWNLILMQAEGGKLGLLFISDGTAQLWKRNTDCEVVASWVLGRTVKLDKLLSLNSDFERNSLMIVGFAESNNVVFLFTNTGLFMVELESLQFKKIPKPGIWSWYYPFESIYAAGT